MARTGVVTQNIGVLLKKDPHAEHDDKLLVMLYWMEVDGIKELGEAFIKKATSSETICRMKRRYLQKESN